MAFFVCLYLAQQVNISWNIELWLVPVTGCVVDEKKTIEFLSHSTYGNSIDVSLLTHIFFFVWIESTFTDRNVFCLFRSRSLPFTLHRPQIDIQPSEREAIFSDELRPSDPRNVGPCGGFSRQYACMCDFHGITYRYDYCYRLSNFSFQWEIESDSMFLSIRINVWNFIQIFIIFN